MATAVVPEAPGTTGQHALDWLRQAIATGALTPGERIPQEAMAKQIGVSIGPVREALRTLEQEGQVTYRPRRGYFVTELNLSDLEEIYELRRLLEARAARRVMQEGISPATVIEMERAAAQCESAARAGNIGEELDANRRFHFAVLDSPENRHTMRLIRTLWDSTESYRALYYNSPVEREASIEAHQRILDALKSADADALVGELDDHRDRALEVLRRLLPD